MSNIVNLLERVRTHLPKASDYALAKALHMQQSNLRKALQGKQGLGIKAIVRASEITGMDAKEVAAIVECERAKDPDEKEFWRVRSPRISAAIVTALALFAAVNHKDVQAFESGKTGISVNPSIPYAK